MHINEELIVFDTIANEYDNWYTTKLGRLVDKTETNNIISLLNPEKGMRILDVGCGSGNYSIKLAKMGFEVVGIDISKNMIDIAREKCKDSNLNISFYVGDSFSLPLQEESFDAIISVTAIEFFNDVQRNVNDLFRFVKKDGRIVIATINKDSSWGELYETSYFQENTVFRYANLLNKDDLKNIRPDKFIELRECLFFPPDTEEGILDIDIEYQLVNKNRGGFICGLWKN